MDFSAITLFSVMKSKLETLSERQSVLAQNIANADTPHYKAKDIVEPDFKKMVRGVSGGSAQNLHQNSSSKLAMSVTNPSHMMSHAPSSSVKVVNVKNTQEISPNGNNVVLEEEMSKIAANQGEYQKIINLYGKAISMFKTAIGNPNTGA